MMSIYKLFVLFCYVSSSAFAQQVSWGKIISESKPLNTFINSDSIACKEVFFLGSCYDYKKNNQLTLTIYNKLNKSCKTNRLVLDAPPSYEYVYYRYTKKHQKKIETYIGSYRPYKKIVYKEFDNINKIIKNEDEITTYGIETDFQLSINILANIIYESSSGMEFLDERGVLNEIYFNKTKIKDQLNRVIEFYTNNSEKYKRFLNTKEFYFYSKIIASAKQGLAYQQLFEEGKTEEAEDLEFLFEAKNIKEIIDVNSTPVLIQAANWEIQSNLSTDEEGTIVLEENVLFECIKQNITNFTKIGVIYTQYQHDENKWLVENLGDYEYLQKNKVDEKVIDNSKNNIGLSTDFDYLIIVK